MRLTVPFGGDGENLEVEVKNLALVSQGRSEAELQKINVDDIVEKHLYDIIKQRNSLPGLCQALQDSGSVVLGRDLFLCKNNAQVNSSLKPRTPDKIDVRPDKATILLPII